MKYTSLLRQNPALWKVGLLAGLFFCLTLTLPWTQTSAKTWEFGLAELGGFAEFSFSADEEEFSFGFSGHGYYPVGDLTFSLNNDELESKSSFGVLSPGPVVFENSLSFPVSLNSESELKFWTTVFGSSGATLDLYLRKTPEVLLWGTPKEEDMLIEGLGDSGVEVLTLNRGPAINGEGYIYYGKSYIGFESDSKARVLLEKTEGEDYTFFGGSRSQGTGSAMTEVTWGAASIEVEGVRKFKVTAGGDDYIHLLLDGTGLDGYSVPPIKSSAYHKYEEFSITGYYLDGGVREVEMEGS